MNLATQVNTSFNICLRGSKPRSRTTRLGESVCVGLIRIGGLDIRVMA